MWSGQRATITVCSVISTFVTAASGQTVQLPTVHVFGTNSSVLVPDRGGAYLGGVSSHRSATIHRGVPVLGRVPGAAPLFRHRGSALSTGTSSAYVTATIIDLQEWDQAVLDAAQRQPPQRVDPVQEKAAFLTRHMGRSNGGPTGDASSKRDPLIQAKAQVPRPSVGAENDLRGSAGFDQLMTSGRQAMATRQYVLAREYFEKAARLKHNFARRGK